VTQPSQVRYVHYFNEIFKGTVKSPLLVYLDKIELKTAPHLNGNGCKPIFEMKKGEQLIYTNKKGTRDRQAAMIDHWPAQQVHELDTIQSRIVLQGDIQCFLSNWGMLKVQKICRFTFNATFVPEDLELRFNKRQLDPDSFRKSRKVDEEFEVRLRFSKICECGAGMEFSERCEVCCRNFDKGEWRSWLRIKEYLCERLAMNPSILLFFEPDQDDIDMTLSKAPDHEDFSSDGSIE